MIKQTIPDNAKKVFTGITYDVYQWEQKMFDGTYSTFEILKRRLGVQVIVVIKDKILLLKEEQPGKGKFISLVGGCADSNNETAIEVAKRELLEETGLESKELTLWHKQGTEGRIDWNSHYFIAKDCTKIKETHLDSGEKIESYLLSFEEFIEEVKRDDFRNKYFQNLVFKMLNKKDELEKFKQLLLEEI